MEQRRLYLTYSTFYFAYFAALGIFTPYFPLYLKSLGISGPRIAILLALGPASRFLFPALWGLWADRAGHRKLLVVLSLSGACAVFSLLYWAQRFWAVALVLFLYGFLLAPSIPLVEGMVQEESDRRRFSYGPVRLWGSLGFIASTLLYGRLLDWMPVETVLMGILILSGLNILPAAALPADGGKILPTRHSLRRELNRPEILRFLCATALMQASHGAYYAYFSLHLDRHGYSRTAIGAYWTLAVAAEIGMMLLSSRLLEVTGPRRLISMSLGVAALRWLLLMAGVDPFLLAFGQILHAFSFGLFHVSAVHATHRLFPDALRSSGQSLYSSLTYGLGNLVGFFGCAASVDALGVRGLFGLSSALALFALLISLSLPAALSRRET
ncbi:MAG: MFS transporter [Acidobacteria bacterium]|nr:MFS transporter [Acidobacteriota bacterium]